MALAAGSASVLPEPRCAAAALPCPRRCLRLLPPRPSHRRCPFAFAFPQLAAGRSTAMDNGAVYNETTEPQATPPRRLFGCALRHLWGWRLPIKALQAVLSLLAVICEEIVEDCIKCGGLYFFEFTSCSAFLLSILILGVYCSDAYETFQEDKVQRVNFWAMLAIGGCFLLASIVLAATSSGSPVEKAACVFGFLASVAFLAEIIIDYFRGQKQNISGRSANPGNTQGATENQPLNKQS